MEFGALELRLVWGPRQIQEMGIELIALLCDGMSKKIKNIHNSSKLYQSNAAPAQCATNLGKHTRSDGPCAQLVHLEGHWLDIIADKSCLLAQT